MKRVLTVCILCVSVAAPGSSARAQVPHQVVIAGYQYLGGGSVNVPFVTSAGLHTAGSGMPVQRGDTVTFTNLDPITVLAPHSATSCDAPCEVAAPNGTFDTGLLGIGGSSALDTSGLPAGTYLYFCVEHGTSMRGSFTML